MGGEEDDDGEGPHTMWTQPPIGERHGISRFILFSFFKIRIRIH